MASEAARAGMSFERFSALDGRHLEGALRAQFFNSDGSPHAPALSQGEIGCYASHLSIHQLLLADERQDCALVLEDDVQLADDVLSIIDAVLRTLPRWDIIRLSNTPKAVVLPVAALPNGREAVRYWTVPNGAGAYLISRSGAEKFLRAYTKRTLPIDEDLRRPWRNGLDTYGIVPPPVEPDVLGVSRIASMGRPEGIPARRRFEQAAHKHDRIAAWSYRLRTFGTSAFCRAMVRMTYALMVKRAAGLDAAKPLWRLKPSGWPGNGAAKKKSPEGPQADCASV